MNLKALQEAEKALSCIEPPTIGLSFEGMLAALLDVSRRFREKSHHSVASTLSTLMIPLKQHYAKPASSSTSIITIAIAP